VQDPALALGFAELHEVHICSPLKPIEVPLDGITSLRHVNYSTQLGVIRKFAEDALDPAVYITDEDTEQ